MRSNGPYAGFSLRDKIAPQGQGLAPLFPQQIFIRVFTRTAEGKFAP